MLITRNHINHLQEIKSDHCISMYIRTHRAGASDADRIRWKNACAEAAEKLIDRGLDGATVRRIMEPADSLLKDNDFWMKLSDGLCMFLNEHHSEKHILPVEFENKVFVTNEFITGPLYLYFKDRQRFFIYDISKGHNRFFEANRDSITPVIIKDLVPESVDDVPELDDQQESIQQHGEDIFHGQGAAQDHEDIKLEKYLKALSDGMHEIFVGETVPLVLSGPEKIVARFRQINDYSPTVDVYVSGSNEDMDPVELHERAWYCIEQYMSDEKEIESDTVMNQSMKNMVLTDAEEITRTLKLKNISKLVLNENFQSYEDDKLLKINALIKSAVQSGAEIRFAEEAVMNKLKLDMIAFKYY